MTSSASTGSDGLIRSYHLADTYLPSPLSLALSVMYTMYDSSRWSLAVLATQYAATAPALLGPTYSPRYSYRLSGSSLSVRIKKP